MEITQPGGGGASLTVTDGITPVVNVTTIDFNTGATVTSGGAGIAVIDISSGGTPGGSTTQLQYNNAGAFGGISGATTNGTAVTFASTALVASNIVNSGTLTLPTSTDTLVARATTDTLINKNLTRRLVTVNAPGATPSTNTDNVDIAKFTGLAAAITSMTTNLSGTPVEGQYLMFQFLDNGTARAITWGASFSATTVALPTTTVISTLLRVGFQWNGSTWACIATC